MARIEESIDVESFLFEIIRNIHERSLLFGDRHRLARRVTNDGR